jgi:hypothetical protein
LPSFKTIPELIEKLSHFAIGDVAKVNRDQLWEHCTRNSQSVDRTFRQLFEILRERVSSASQKRQRARIQATAAIVTGQLLAYHSHRVDVGQLNPEIFREGINSLLAAADPSGSAQRTTVDACQVYDYAAWGLRTVFGVQSALAGLPLAPDVA